MTSSQNWREGATKVGIWGDFQNLGITLSERGWIINWKILEMSVMDDPFYGLPSSHGLMAVKLENIFPRRLLQLLRITF